MKVKEFIEWLNTQNQEADVMVLKTRIRNYRMVSSRVDFDPEECSEHPEGAGYLFLGEDS